MGVTFLEADVVAGDGTQVQEAEEVEGATCGTDMGLDGRGIAISTQPLLLLAPVARTLHKLFLGIERMNEKWIAAPPSAGSASPSRITSPLTLNLQGEIPTAPEPVPGRFTQEVHSSLSHGNGTESGPLSTEETFQRWEALWEHTSGVWHALKDVRKQLERSSQYSSDFSLVQGHSLSQPQNQQLNHKRGDKVSVSLLQRAKMVDGMVEEHVVFVRRELEQYYILPLLRRMFNRGNVGSLVGCALADVCGINEVLIGTSGPIRHSDGQLEKLPTAEDACALFHQVVGLSGLSGSSGSSGEGVKGSEDGAPLGLDMGMDIHHVEADALVDSAMLSEVHAIDRSALSPIAREESVDQNGQIQAADISWCGPKVGLLLSRTMALAVARARLHERQWKRVLVLTSDVNSDIHISEGCVVDTDVVPNVSQECLLPGIPLSVDASLARASLTETHMQVAQLLGLHAFDSFDSFVATEGEEEESNNNLSNNNLGAGAGAASSSVSIVVDPTTFSAFDPYTAGAAAVEWELLQARTFATQAYFVAIAVQALPSGDFGTGSDSACSSDRAWLDVAAFCDVHQTDFSSPLGVLLVDDNNNNDNSNDDNDDNKHQKSSGAEEAGASSPVSESSGGYVSNMT